MSNSPPLLVVRLTPPGRGAVAVLRVEGPGAVEAVASRFQARDGRPLADYPADHIALGRFGGFGGEEVVVRRCNDDAVELHCHGGRAVVAMIEDSLIKAGCRSTTWQEWTAASGFAKNDPIASAALAALAEAHTERCAAILLDQYHGALRRELDEIKKHLGGEGDSPIFADTKIGAVPAKIGAVAACAARRRIDAILSRAKLGRHLTCPWSVVLAGRPNVGKSSLINALAGYDRTIVHHQPGTTRDAVSLITSIDGWPVELCDTAGLRATGDAVERAGIDRARHRLARADLVVLVGDQSEPWSAEDQALADKWPSALWVHNKCDLRVEGDSPIFADTKIGTVPVTGRDGRPPGVSTSAMQGEGIDVLLAEISRRLVPNVPPPGAGVPFTAEQMAMVEAILP